jgi:hypothetical protein
MKYLGWILLTLGILVVAFAWLVVPPRRRPSPECTGRILIIPGPHGLPMECVCDEARLATCFNLGP